MEHWQALENFAIEEGEPIVFRDVKIQQEDDWRASVMQSSWIRSGARFDPEGRLAFRGMRDGRSSKLAPEIFDEETETIRSEGDDYAMTLAGMSYEIDICRERVRSLIERALRKLRHPSRAKFLKDFADD
jgi:DNA-directed RNA polymerase sigma subunit (sigma70/sigma32)